MVTYDSKIPLMLVCKIISEVERKTDPRERNVNLCAIIFDYLLVSPNPWRVRMCHASAILKALAEKSKSISDSYSRKNRSESK